MKVFLDTNVLVSAYATRGLCVDILHLLLAEHELVVGETVLRELRRVLRDKLRLPDALVVETEEFLRKEARVVSDSASLNVEVRDQGDVAVLCEAVAAGVDALVIGDWDLLEIAGQAPVLILSPRGFWERLRGVKNFNHFRLGVNQCPIE